MDETDEDVEMQPQPQESRKAIVDFLMKSRDEIAPSILPSIRPFVQSCLFSGAISDFMEDIITRVQHTSGSSSILQVSDSLWFSLLSVQQCKESYANTPLFLT